MKRVLAIISKNQRFVRFGFVGGCGTIVNLGLLSLLVKALHFDVLVSAAVAIEASIVFNFFLNHHYTFGGRTCKEPWSALLIKLGKFNLGSLGGAAISFTTFSLLYKLGHLNFLLADIIAIGVAMSWNYFISTHYIWKVVDAPVED